VKALCWDGQAVALADRPDPTPGEGEALVRVRLAGVCSTDLQITKGYMAYTGVMGHEFMGEVVEGPPELSGRRVTGEINFACGRCALCGRGLGRHCPERTVMGIMGQAGCFAELLRIPARNLHVVPEEVSDEQAAFAEPVAAAFEILEQVHLPPASRAVVLGDGKLGLLIAQVLRLTGARVVAVGRHPDKLGRVADLGVETTLADDFQPAKDADLVVDATGSTAGFEAAVAAVRPRGTLVLKSTVAAEHRLSLAPLVIDEVTVVGSRCGPFPPALAALASQSVEVTPLIDAVRPLAEGVAAIAQAAEPGVLKVLLRMPAAEG